MNGIDHIRSVLFFSLLVGSGLIFSAPLALAQESNPTYMQMFLTTVKSDRVAEFENLLQERAAGLARSGEGRRSVYQMIVGDQFTYLMADFLPSLAVLDGPPQPHRAPPPGWGERNDAATTAQTILLMRRYPELRTPGAVEPDRDLVRVRIRRNAPGRTQDYYEWQAEQLLPALREAGVTGFLSNRVVLGGSSQTWVSFQSIESLASTENNVLAESMGERQAEQMLARGAAMLVHTEDLIMRLRPDLGYVSD
ncbi:MAG: hypothetical protein HKN84_09565 [Gammaproteobacteria bacterium]|nr:hypothetical protein [Gammaproteobacteria bacterium]